MQIEKAIELLSGASCGYITVNDEFKDAANMGRKALTVLAYGRGHRLDDKGLWLLLQTEREGK